MLSFLRSAKYVVLDYPDFTIMHYELHSPSASKALMVHGHGRKRPFMDRIYNTSEVLHFYTPANTVLEISGMELLRFQCRISPLVPVESIQVGGYCADYEVHPSPLLQDQAILWFYRHPLLNPKPVINSAADLVQRNYHDVLTVKPGRMLPLSLLLMQVPNYREVHCFFCRK